MASLIPDLHRYSIKYLLLQLLLIYLLPLFTASAQKHTPRTKEKKHNTDKQDISLFGSDEVLNISLYFDLGMFLKKTSYSDSFEAKMTIRPGEKDSINKTVNITYRGLLRRELCSFPPIEIDFRDPLHSDSGKIKKLKLVTHCERGSNTDEYIIREYLVYKLYNALTDTSFKKRKSTPL